MRVIGQAAELGPSGGKPAVAVGMFDGVHLGHQRVLRYAMDEARRQGVRSVGITFDQHPSAVVAPERQPPLIYSLAQRLQVMEELGLDVVWLIHFDRAFSQQSGEDFIAHMVRDFGGVESICIGENFTFGYKRSGNVALLERLGHSLGFAVHALPPVEWEGQAVSSTRIRESIQAGNLELASRMLGRRYSLGGTVILGDQLGRQLGFPTANLDVTGLVLPPGGVYAGWVDLEGQPHRAVMNVGLRPTLAKPKPELRVEVHILEFAGDLYGKEIEFRFLSQLRAEQKFNSTTALKEQIARDVAQAGQLLAESSL